MFFGNGEGKHRGFKPQRTVGSNNVPGNKIHRRTTNKASHKQIYRIAVEGHGGIHLLNDPVLHDHNPVAHGHGLNLVVRYVNHGGLQPLVQAADFNAHLHPQFGIQVGQGFVKQKDLGLAHDCPAQCHPLPLSTGKGFGLAAQEFG